MGTVSGAPLEDADPVDDGPLDDGPLDDGPDDDGPDDDGPDDDGPDDAELVRDARTGDERAVSALWSRHVGPARRLAASLGSAGDADDLVSEAFARVLRVLAAGGGPTEAFRPYLLSTVRRLSVDAHRQGRRVLLTDDADDLVREPTASTEDLVTGRRDAQAALDAWLSLPEEARLLLWHLVVEQETPAEVAPLLGISPNAVASRATRARERLRQAYLTAHLGEAPTPQCVPVRRLLGARARDALSLRDRIRVDRHLAGCAACRRASAEADDGAALLRRAVGHGVVVLPGLAAAGAVGGVADVLGGASGLGVGHAAAASAAATTAAAGTAGAAGTTAAASAGAAGTAGAAGATAATGGVLTALGTSGAMTAVLGTTVAALGGAAVWVSTSRGGPAPTRPSTTQLPATPATTGTTGAPTPTTGTTSAGTTVTTSALPTPGSGVPVPPSPPRGSPTSLPTTTATTRTTGTATATGTATTSRSVPTGGPTTQQGPTGPATVTPGVTTPVGTATTGS